MSLGYRVDQFFFRRRMLGQPFDIELENFSNNLMRYRLDLRGAAVPWPQGFDVFSKRIEGRLNIDAAHSEAPRIGTAICYPELGKRPSEQARPRQRTKISIYF